MHTPLTLCSRGISPRNESLFALCQQRYPCDKRQMQGQVIGLVRKETSRDRSDSAGIVTAQRHLQTWACLTRLGAM